MDNMNNIIERTYDNLDTPEKPKANYRFKDCPRKSLFQKIKELFKKISSGRDQFRAICDSIKSRFSKFKFFVTYRYRF